jgi:hypothetical protein
LAGLGAALKDIAERGGPRGAKIKLPRGGTSASDSDIVAEVTAPPPLPTPPTPGGVSTSVFGGRTMMNWGRGDAEAIARIDTLTRGELEDMGVTPSIARAWYRFYDNEVIRTPTNPSAAGRAELMRYAYHLLTGTPT